MRLPGAVRVKRSTLIVAVILSLFAVSFLLVGRLDIVLLDDAVKQTNGNGAMCGCGVADYGPSEGQKHLNVADDGRSTTHVFHQDERASRKTATPVSSEQTSKSDFDQVLRLLVQRSRPDSANVSLDDARRTLDELKSAVRLMEQRLRDAIDSTEVNNNNSNNNDNDYDYKLADNNNASHPVKSPSGPAHQVVDVVDRVLRSNGATSDEKRQSHATVERFHRLTSDVHVTDDVMQLLRTVLEMTFAAGRKRRPKETVPSPVVHRSNRRPWKQFDNSITQYALYDRAADDISRDANGRRQLSYVDRLLKNMASLSVKRIEEMVDRGTQLKLVLTLADGTKVLFKPMRSSKFVESNPNHFVFNEMERHHAEIAAFHLDRLFDFRRVPPVAGRYLNLTSDIIPFASPHLARTFFISPVGNVCFYGECKYYCDSHHAVCGSPDVIEGSAAVFLPSDDEFKGVYPRKTWPNPWAQVYSKRGKLPPWKTHEDFCDEVKKMPPFDTGRRLLDLMDMALFDFLTGNLDRHHYYTFKRFGNDTYPILTDNGRGFGRPNRDDIELLAPIYQCCLIRASTLEKVVNFVSATLSQKPTELSLSQALNRSLAGDVIDGVLHDGHLAALDRRIKTVAIIVYDCLNRTLTANGDVNRKQFDDHSFRRIVVDDGF